MQRLFRILHAMEAATLSVAILAIAGITIANVIARNVFGSSLAAAEELSRFLIVLVCFVGLSYGASRGRHIRMTAIVDQLPERPQKQVMVFVCATTSALCLVLAWFAFQYALSVQRRSPVLGIPLRYVYLAAPFGLVLAGIQYALAVAKNLRTEGVHVAYDADDTESSEPGTEAS